MLLILLSVALADEPAPAAEAAPPAPAPAAPAPAAPTAAPVTSGAPEPTEPVEPFEIELQKPRELKFEVSFDLAGTIVDDAGWGALSEGGTLSWGLRAGYHVRPWLTPYLSLGHNSGAMDQSAGETGTFRTAFDQTRLDVGAKFGWMPSRYFGVYANVQGQGLLGVLRMDDDQDDDENPGQIEVSGATAGIGGAVGIEAVAPTGSRMVAVVFHFEVGYAAYAPLQLDQVATLDPSGVSIRTGVGLKF